MTSDGRPNLRPARPDELDQEGNLLSYAACHPGLNDRQWKALGTQENLARGCYY